jgi:hypothetical protein
MKTTLVAITLACVCATPASTLAAQTLPFLVSDTISTTDSSQTGRLNATGSPSTISAPKTYPGTADSLPHNFKSYSFTNTTGAALGVQVNVTGITGTGIHSSVYLTNYDPANLATNYLGDEGPSGIGSYSFMVSAGASYVVIVNALTPTANLNGTVPFILSVNQILTTFTNTTNINIPTIGNANPYPLNINSTNLVGHVTKVTGVLNGFSHARPSSPLKKPSSAKSSSRHV